MKKIDDTLILNGNTSKLLLRLAIPTILLELITIIYNAADTFFVGRIGNEATAAVGVVYSVMALLQALGYGVGVGVGNVISMKLGAGDRESANRYASSALLLSFVFGSAFMAFGLSFTNPVLRAVGASQTILPYAREYATYIFIAAPFMCMTFVLNSVMRAAGHAGKAMVGSMVGGIFNMCFDPLFIFTLKMGVKGAAVCTMLGQMLSFSVFVVLFAVKSAPLRIHPLRFSRKASDYLYILRVGSPTFLRQGMGSVSTALLNVQAASVGDAAVAAVTVFAKVYALLRSAVIGLGQGYQTLAGYNYGARKYERVRHAFFTAVLVGTAGMSILALLLFIFKESVATFFRNDDSVASIAVPALALSCISLPTLAYSTFVNQTYQCLGFSFRATLLASMRQGLFFIPLLYLLCSFDSLWGIRAVQPAADVLTFFVSIPFQIYFFRKYLRETPQDPPDLLTEEGVSDYNNSEVKV